MRSAALTETGVAHTRNEDAYWCDGDRGIFILADGIGASQGGETAAKMAVEVISADLTLALDRGLSELDLADSMHDSFREASTDIYNCSLESEELQDMACSAVATIITK